MTFPRFLGTGLLVTMLIASASPASVAADAEMPDQVVTAAAQDVMQRFAGRHLTQDDCVAGLNALIESYADLGLTTGQILGRHWVKADDTQKAELIKLVHDYLIGSWSGHLNDVPADQHIDIVGSEAGDDNRTIVHSILVTPDGDIAVDWTVDHTTTGRDVISDIKVEGVSMVQTLRADFTAVIRANDGKIQPLIDALRSKIKSY